MTVSLSTSDISRPTPSRFSALLGLFIVPALILVAPTTASAQDLIVENFNDYNEYSESWGAEWSNVAVDTASYGGGTSPTLANRGFASRSTNNGPAPIFSSPVANSDKPTSWVADGNGGYAVRYGDAGISGASNSNTAQRHHNVQMNLAKVGNYRSSPSSPPNYLYWDNFHATKRRYLRFTAWRDASPDNNPAPAGTAKFVVGVTSPPTVNCLVPNSSIGPWNVDGTQIEGFTLTTTKQVFVMDLMNSTRFKADPVYRVNVRFSTFGTCSTANQQSAPQADLTRALNLSFGYWRSSTTGYTGTQFLDPIRFYLDDIILSERLPGYDTTASLTLINETTPINQTNFGIVLAAIPSHPVTINLAPSVAGVISLSTTSITFTPADWNQPRTVTVDPVNDGIPNHGQRTADIVFTKGPTLDLMYAGPSVPVPGNITITVQDEATAAVNTTVTLTSIEEQTNTSTTASVVLASVPTAPVTITVSSSDTGAFTVAGGSLVFDNTNWNIPQIVTLNAVDDHITAGPNRSANLQFAISTTCPFYGALANPADVTIEIVNNGLPVGLTHMSVE